MYTLITFIAYLLVSFNNELYEKEKSYVEKLGLAVKYGKYIHQSKTDPSLIQMPEDLVGKEQFVSNNVNEGDFFYKGISILLS